MNKPDSFSDSSSSSNSTSVSSDFSSSSSSSFSLSGELNIPLVVPFEDLKLPEKPIKRSNFGKVYKAQCHGETVAVKMLHGKAYDDDEEVFEEMKREVAIMRTLRHPKLALFMSTCSNAPSPTIIMEFIEGRDLGDVLKKAAESNQPLQAPQIFKIMKGLAIGLNWLNTAAQIIHRDIKLPNVMVNDNFDVKILDFGFSCFRKGKDERLVGTPIYVAPELWAGDTTGTIKTDVYAYGILLAGLWRGNDDLYPTDDMDELKRWVMNGKRPDLPESIPPLIEGLINRCWAMNPKDRPTFGEIIKEIDDMAPIVLIKEEMIRDIWRNLEKDDDWAVDWKSLHTGIADELNLDEELRVFQTMKKILRSKKGKVGALDLDRFCHLFGPITKQNLVTFDFLCTNGYFHGEVSGEEAIRRLAIPKPAKGFYLIRFSTTEPYCLTLTYWSKGEKKPGNMKIYRRDSDGHYYFAEGENNHHPTLKALIKSKKGQYKIRHRCMNGSPFVPIAVYQIYYNTADQTRKKNPDKKGKKKK